MLRKLSSELEEKVAAARAQRADGEEEGEREMLITKQEVLSDEVKALRKELAGYADNDPGRGRKEDKTS